MTKTIKILGDFLSNKADAPYSVVMADASFF